MRHERCFVDWIALCIYSTAPKRSLWLVRMESRITVPCVASSTLGKMKLPTGKRGHPSEACSKESQVRAGVEPGEMAGVCIWHYALQSTRTSVIWLAPQPSYKAASVDSFILARQERKLRLPRRMSKVTKISCFSAERWAQVLVSCLWASAPGFWGAACDQNTASSSAWHVQSAV